MPVRFVAVCCFLLFIFSCTRQEKGAVTFSVGGAPNEIVFWEMLAGEFEKETGIKVNLLRQPTDTDQRRQGLLIPLQARRSDPDVFLLDVGWIAQFAAADWLEPLDPYVEKDALETGEFFSRILELADRYEGRLIALPVYVDAGLLYYRKDLLEKYGYEKPPQTWAELVEHSLKVQEGERKTNANFCGFVWQGAQYEGLVCNFLEFAGSNNGGILVKGDSLAVNMRENVESVQFMRDTIHRYKISPPNTFTEMKEEEVRIFFQQGNALFERNWPYAWALHQSEGSPVRGKVGIASLPHFSGGRSVATLGGWHIGISRYSDVKSESVAFARFITSFSTQKRLSLELGWNPGRKDVYQDKEVAGQSPHLAAMREVFENAVPRPNLPYYSQISEVLQQKINMVLAGRLTAEKGFSEAEQQINKVAQRYKK